MEFFLPYIYLISSKSHEKTKTYVVYGVTNVVLREVYKISKHYSNMRRQ